MEKIKILIVDDHPMMRDALQTALNQEPDMQVSAEATNGYEAVHFAGEYQPDVILMDLLMPGMDGLQAIEEIFKVDPQAKILVVTSLEDDDKIIPAIQAGAMGYFPKSAPRAYLLDAIRKVADGIPYLPSGITIKLFKNLRDMKTTPLSPAVSSTLNEALTSRQQEILALLSEGNNDQEIGKILNIEEATVRSHVHRILQKLGVENRFQAVAIFKRPYKKE